MRFTDRYFVLSGLLVFTACGGENRTHPLPEYQPGTPDPMACVPNLDGRIDAAEMAPSLGIPVSFRVSAAGTTPTVDLLGETNDAGDRTWDWTGNAENDQHFSLEAESPEGKWYAAYFPAGEFVTRADAGGSLEAVYRHDEQALWLLGLASRESNPPEGRTLLPYQAPVELFRFPIEPGASWTSTGTVQNGLFRGVPYAGYDVYDVGVPALGRLELPDLTFTQAHQVRIDVTVYPAFGAATWTRQVSWVFECFGEVARATSRLNEPEEDFTTAAEVRRIGL